MTRPYLTDMHLLSPYHGKQMERVAYRRRSGEIAVKEMHISRLRSVPDEPTTVGCLTARTRGGRTDGQTEGRLKRVFTIRWSKKSYMLRPAVDHTHTRLAFGDFVLQPVCRTLGSAPASLPPESVERRVPPMWCPTGGPLLLTDVRRIRSDTCYRA